MSSITIPKPCHQDWNDMTPTTQGAFCSACAKEVVDFTTMTDDEVKHYLLQRNGDRVCGKFRNDQIERVRISIPASVFYSRVAAWKRFLAVLLISFGSFLFGCDVTTNGKVKVGEVNDDHRLLGDTAMTSPTLKGKPAFIDTAVTVETIESHTTTGIITCPITITGDAEVVPDIPSFNEVITEKPMMDTPKAVPHQDSLKPKTKLPADSTCREQHYY